MDASPVVVTQHHHLGTSMPSGGVHTIKVNQRQRTRCAVNRHRCSIRAGLAQSRLLPGPVREADGPPDAGRMIPTCGAGSPLPMGLDLMAEVMAAAARGAPTARGLGL